MYIKYNGNKYSCNALARSKSTVTYRGLPADFPAPVSGDIVLYADDGFEMRRDAAEDYLRQTFADGVLTLTNVPEPEPIPEPDPDEPTDDGDKAVTWNELAKAYTEGVNSIDE